MRPDGNCDGSDNLAGQVRNHEGVCAECLTWQELHPLSDVVKPHRESAPFSTAFPAITTRSKR